MPFPAGWDLVEGIRPPTGQGRSLRFFVKDTTVASALFSDLAYAFITGQIPNPMPTDPPGGTPGPVALGDAKRGGTPVGGGPTIPATPKKYLPAGQPQQTVATAWSRNILVRNLGASALEISFNGVNVHGYIPAGQKDLYLERYEGGISIRGEALALVPFVIEAW